MTYQTPGVYVEEVPSAIRPIAGVGTSTAGFIGIIDTAQNYVMPVDPASETGAPYPPPDLTKEERITGWEAFKKKFGDIQAGNKVLAHAVYGFFNNGGTVCYVRGVAGADEYQAALDRFKSVDEIAIVAVPGEVDANVQGMVLDHCETMQDRFAVLDAQRLEGQEGGYTVNAIKGDPPVRNAIDGYGALYFPWLKIPDPGEEPGEENRTYVVPPSGHLAGIYARSDAQRGVHKTPANEVIRGPVGTEHALHKI